MKAGLGTALGALLLLVATAGCQDDAEARAALDARLERGPVDWSFASELPSAIVQTGSPPRPRAVWIVVDRGALYVPTGLVPGDELTGALDADASVVLRVGDDLYLRRATPVEDRDATVALWDRVSSKYATPGGVPEDGHLFRLDPAAP